MIAYVLFALAATPIFGAPASETVNVQQHPAKEHEVQQQISTLSYEGKPQTLNVQYPFGQVSYPNVPYYTRKTESGAVEVPLTPDAIVIPYSYPNYPSYYPYYQNVGSRHQVPAPYPGQYNQYPYVPESFLVVPVPGVQRVSQTTTNYAPQSETVPRLLYYLPKSYYPTGYQTPIHQSQEQFQAQHEQQQQTHQVVAVEKTSAGVVTHGEGVVPQGETAFETGKPVEGSQQQ